MNDPITDRLAQLREATEGLAARPNLADQLLAGVHQRHASVLDVPMLRYVTAIGAAAAIFMLGVSSRVETSSLDSLDDEVALDSTWEDL